MPNIEKLPPFDEEGLLNAIVETPKGCRNKLAFDVELGIFRSKATLPAGHVFPFDFGFIPGTKGEDGDPLDVLILMEQPLFPGVLVPSRLLGVIKAEQTERDGKTERNDRLIAVANDDGLYTDARSLHDLPKRLLDEIERFFESYNDARGKRFKPLARGGSEEAKRLVRGTVEKRGSERS